MKNLHFLKFILLTILISSSIEQDCSSYEVEKINEGYKPLCYLDSQHLPTIGVGSQMEANKNLINQITGGNYDNLIKSGDPKYYPCGSSSAALNDNQIKQIFDANIQSAKTCASNFAQLPPGPYSAVTDMAFNLGCNKLNQQWPSFHNALINHDYVEAGYQLTHGSSGQESTLCAQRRDRCLRNKNCICSASSNPLYCNECDKKCSQFPKVCCGGQHSNCCPTGCCQNGYPSCCPNNTCCPSAYPVCCQGGCCPAGTYCCQGNKCCRSNENNEEEVIILSFKSAEMSVNEDKLKFLD